MKAISKTILLLCSLPPPLSQWQNKILIKLFSAIKKPSQYLRRYLRKAKC